MKPIILHLRNFPLLPSSTAAALIAAAVLAIAAVPVAAPAHADEGGAHDEVEAAAPVDPPGNAYCPVLTDEPVDPDFFVEYEGRKIYFCCGRCRRDFLADPQQYLGNLPALDGGGEPITASGADHHDNESQLAEAAGSAGGAHAAHDHETDHAADGESAGGISEWLGRLHPLAVHFPIGLLIFAFILELLGLVAPREPLRQGARLAVAGAALAAVVAAALGWLAAAGSEFPGLEATLASHRWAGLTTALLACATLAASELYHRRGGGFRFAYLSLLTLAAVLVGIAGHLGASLIYGPDYLSL